MIFYTNTMRLTKVTALLLLFAATAPLFSIGIAFADSTQDLTVTPVVIDEKAKQQDIINETISITNTSGRQLELYPSVNDVQDESGQQPFSVAQNGQQALGSLSNWIELTRGVIQLGPGEQKTVPFTITVPTDAAAASYHAVISFSDGSTRDNATAKPPLATITVNVDLQADIKELMQLNSFSTDNIVFAGDDVLFKYQLQNTGNQALDPKGEVRIYDRKGEEVASVDVNGQGNVVSPDQVAQLASVWSGAQGFGQYKAVLDVDYGTNQVASVQDITYFWIIPWKQLLGVSIMTLIVFIILALYFHRWLEDRHFGKLAAAGLLKAEAFVHWRKELPPPPPPITARVDAKVDQMKAVIAEKKEQLSDFKRKGFAPPGMEAKPPAPPKPQTVASTSATIDLKNMIKPSANAPVSVDHVINLKGK